MWYIDEKMMQLQVVEDVEEILNSFYSLLILCTALLLYKDCRTPLVKVLLPAPEGP